MSGRAPATGPGKPGTGPRRPVPPPAAAASPVAPPGPPGPSSAAPAPPPPPGPRAAAPGASVGPAPGASRTPPKAPPGPTPVARVPAPVSPPPAAESQGKPAVTVARGPRRARVYVTRIDPWSVMKAAFMLSLSLAIILVAMLASLWWVLDSTGVFDVVSRNVDEVVGGGTTTFDLMNILAFSRVMGVAVLMAAVEIVLVSALGTLFAFLYNLTVGITGGIEVTLSDDV